MKKKEKKSLLSKSFTELGKLADDLTREIEAGGIKRTTEQNKNTRALKALRIKRAILHTIMRQKQLEETV